MIGKERKLSLEWIEKQMKTSSVLNQTFRTPLFKHFYKYYIQSNSNRNKHSYNEYSVSITHTL